MMTRMRWMIVLIMSVGLLVILQTSATAGSFVDLYVGPVVTSDTDVTAYAQSFPLPRGTAVTRRVHLNPSLIIGGRYGAWDQWWGWALDVSRFQQTGDGVDLTLVPVSYLLLLRRPPPQGQEMKTERVQPYLGIGPGFFFPHVSVDFRPTLSESAPDTHAYVGLDVRVGLTRPSRRPLSLFWEYRFTHGRFLEEESAKGSPLEPLRVFSPGGSPIQATVNTHHLLMGISFR